MATRSVFNKIEWIYTYTPFCHLKNLSTYMPYKKGFEKYIDKMYRITRMHYVYVLSKEVTKPGKYSI